MTDWQAFGGSGTGRFGPPIFGRPPWVLAPLGSPDLAAYAGFRVSQSSDGKWFKAAGIMMNLGDAVATRSVEVAVGVTTYFHDAFRRTDERRSRIGSGLRPGETVDTEPTSAPLRFRTDGYTYCLEIHIDIQHELGDVTRSNNYFWMRHWESDLSAMLAKEGDSKSYAIEAAEGSS